MIWILYAAATAGILFVAVAVVGTLLPLDHEASRSAKLRASAEQVFALVSGPQEWRPGSKNDPPSRVVSSVRPKCHVTMISDPSLPFGGTWAFEIEPTVDGCEAGCENGCELRITERGFVTNPIFRFISRFVIGHHTSLDTYLKHLKANLGE